MRDIKKEFKAAVKEMKQNHESGTYYWWLPNPVDDNNDWAIVLGWQDGYEPDLNNPCMDGTYNICAKLAYQSKNNIMQCDYDVDWDMPYNEITSEVDDNQISICSDTNTDEVIDWLLKCYESIRRKSNMKNKYEKLFDEFLDIVEFKLVKYRNGYGVIDLQGANLGDIESERFTKAEQILDQMDIYINDYFINDIEECLEEKDKWFEWRDQDWGYLVAMARPLLPDNKWEFDVMDMIIYNFDKIDLSNCVYENGED